jgi:dihydrofolate synthase/folylpolyglutamate synthase
MPVTQPNFPYYNTVDQIYHAEWSIPKLARLELLRQSIAALWPNGHPTRFLHIAGTSGKGSTSRFLEVGLGCVGKAGAYMSPHLFDYRERFSIGGEFVSQADIHWAWEERIKPYCLRMALHNPHQVHTFLEVSLLVALAIYEKHGVEWAAIETSVGGRYDHTRALDVVAAVLTNVGTDHANILGKEQWQRTLDKVGIARPGVPFFTSDHNPENAPIIASVCQSVGAELHWVDEQAVNDLVQALERHQLTVAAESLLKATYQKWNAALAYATIRHLCPDVDERRVLEAFCGARLLGRFWPVAENVYADIAHNVEKISALADELQDHFGARGKILVVGMSGKRTPGRVFAALAKVAKLIIVTGASFKGQDPSKVQQELAAMTGNIPVLVINDPRQALAMAQSMQRGDDVIMLTGSTYMIEQALNPDPYLRTLSNTFGWRVQVDTEASGTVQLTLPPPPPPLR